MHITAIIIEHVSYGFGSKDYVWLLIPLGVVDRDS
jgi:hypothetical protein